MLFDEERKPSGKNKRPRPWMLEMRYIEGLGSNWGWIKWGMYRTEDEATKAMAHHQRSWGAKIEIRVTNTNRISNEERK